MKNFQLDELTEEKLELVKNAWLGLIPEDNHELFRAECSQLFDVISFGKSWGDLGDRLNVPIYQSVKDGDDVWALVQIVQSKVGTATWVKLMDIHLSPAIDVFPDTECNTENRLKVFIAALLGILSLAKRARRADTFKVFGRTEALVTFLQGMHDVLSTITTIGTIKGVDVSIEGRWLVFRATDDH
ncbi:MAG: hypothetical protein NTX45_04990 [Proteobacteria bacterium]|nr:hypothetical protein [Pseudomonadota bacterium]